MKKLIAVLTSILLILTLVAGCAPKEEETPQETPPATETPSGNQEPAEPETPDETDTGAFTDGTFNAEGEPDERGWKPTIEITVENGEITDVVYDEVNEEGNKKSEDTQYGESMKAQSGVSPAEAYPQLEESLIETQDPDAVEVVTGATGSSELFKELANEALATNP